MGKGNILPTQYFTYAIYEEILFMREVIRTLVAHHIN